MNKAKAISDETRFQEFTSRILRRVFFEQQSNPDSDGTALFGPIEEVLTELVKETRATVNGSTALLCGDGGGSGIPRRNAPFEEGPLVRASAREGVSPELIKLIRSIGK